MLSLQFPEFFQVSENLLGSAENLGFVLSLRHTPSFLYCWIRTGYEVQKFDQKLVPFGKRSRMMRMASIMLYFAIN